MKFKLSLLIVIYIQFYSLVSVLAEKSIFCKNKIFALEEATIESIHCAIRAKQLTCEQLITAYLERIKKYNLSIHDKPPINSIAEINPFIISNENTLIKYIPKQINL
jgi:amidase